MILKSFKVKSNEKYLNKLLSTRQVKVGGNAVKSIGVILNKDAFSNVLEFKSLTKQIKLSSKALKIAAFTLEDVQEQDANLITFSPKDFGWKDGIKNPELEAFLNQEFDVLISYYTNDSLDLKIATARSKAQFKIGILQTDTRLNDLIIKTNINEFDVFKNEVFKYLTILNKI